LHRGPWRSVREVAIDIGDDVNAISTVEQQPAFLRIVMPTRARSSSLRREGALLDSWNLHMKALPFFGISVTVYKLTV